jgi:hypothetical protein
MFRMGISAGTSPAPGVGPLRGEPTPDFGARPGAPVPTPGAIDPRLSDARQTAVRPLDVVHDEVRVPDEDRPPAWNRLATDKAAERVFPNELPRELSEREVRHHAGPPSSPGAAGRSTRSRARSWPCPFR